VPLQLRVKTCVLPSVAMPAKTCPKCGRLVAFTWDAGDRPPPETPLCTPTESTDCWPRDDGEWGLTFEGTHSAPIWGLTAFLRRAVPEGCAPDESVSTFFSRPLGDPEGPGGELNAVALQPSSPRALTSSG
jgi:hypothetical protein